MARCEALTLKGVQCANSANCPWHSDHGECSICLEKITKNTLLKTECNHSFHSDCFQNWLKESNTCPMCRAPQFAPEPHYIISVFISRSDGPVANLLPLFNIIADLHGVQ